MKIEYIKDSETVIAKIIRNDKWPEGLTFYTDDKDFVQVSTWNYNQGRHLKAHSHKKYKRTSDVTQEVIFIKSGEMKIYLYDRNDNLIKTDCLRQGDIAIIYTGGHAYDILQDNTQIFEIKNGPYPGIENDKKLLEE